MASSYTNNSGIEKIETGAQSGTWGTTTNTNFDIIDRAISGVGAISLSGTTHTLTTSDGALSEGGYRVLVLGGTPSGTNTITISPNDQAKQYFVYNNSGQSAIFTQGSGGNVTVANGSTAIIYADGAGAGAKVAEISSSLSGDPAPQLSANLDVNGNSITSTSNGNVVIAPNGTGDVQLDADTVRVGDSNANATITTNGTGDLTLNTNSGTNSGSITNADGANGDISISPNGTGTVVINTDLDVDNLNINGNTIISTDTDGDISLTPNGAGRVNIGTFPIVANQTVGSGQDGYVLTYDHAGLQLQLEAPATQTVTTPTIQTFTSSGTWTKPAGCTKVKVTVVGGGGGGGCASGQDSDCNVAAGGGGAGGCAIEYIDVSAESSVSVTVGSGGAGGASSGATGSTGGTSSFGAFCSASGGGGGDGLQSGGNSTTYGGDGGVGTGGDINAEGGVGGISALVENTAPLSGVGGNSFFGGGARWSLQTSNGTSNGNAGTLGGGGSGGVVRNVSGTNGAGGAGGAGIVVVEEYYGS
jgi:hypothetical protein